VDSVTSAVLPEVAGRGSAGPVLTQDSGTGAGLRSGLRCGATETTLSGVFLAPPSEAGPGFLAAPRDALTCGARGGALTFDPRVPEGPGVTGPARNERNPLGFLQGEINHKKKKIRLENPRYQKETLWSSI
jgi:hypothetical protein